MAIQPSQLILYAATPHDLEMATAVVAPLRLPISQVTGDYQTAWQNVAAGGSLVFAVGGAALHALYYNPCYWANPANLAGGHTPFALLTGPQTAAAKPNYFVNAAGPLAEDTYKATMMLAYYALNDAYPAGMDTLPPLLAPAEICAPTANADVQISCAPH